MDVYSERVSWCFGVHKFVRCRFSVYIFLYRRVLIQCFSPRDPVWCIEHSRESCSHVDFLKLLWTIQLKNVFIFIVFFSNAWNVNFRLLKCQYSQSHYFLTPQYSMLIFFHRFSAKNIFYILDFFFITCFTNTKYTRICRSYKCIKLIDLIRLQLRMLFEYGAKNYSWHISIGWYATSQNTVEFGEFGYAGVSISNAMQIPGRLHTPVGLNGLCTIGEIVGTCSKSGRTRN